MKKTAFILALMLLPLMFCGCGRDNLAIAKENMAEITTLYFSGRNDADYASICVGTREEPYIKDGNAQKSCDFSLISLTLGDEFQGMRLAAKLEINGKSENLLLEFIGGDYEFDLGRKLSADDEITLKYLDKEIVLQRIRFGCDYEKALEIGVKTFEDQIRELTRGNELSAECYLQILGKEGGAYNQVFWCFTLHTRAGKVYHCIINTQNGEVIGVN